MVHTLFVNEGIIMSYFEADSCTTDTVDLLRGMYEQPSEDGAPPWGEPLPLISSSAPTTPREKYSPATPYEPPGTLSGESGTLWDELRTPSGTPWGTPLGKRRTPPDEPGTSLREGDPLHSPSRQPDTVGGVDELRRQGPKEGTPPSAATTGCTLPTDVCGNTACDNKNQKIFHKILETTTAGGQNWGPFVGRQLCNACYCRYRQRGTVARKNHKYSPDETCQMEGCSSETTVRWHTVLDGVESKVVCHRCYSRTRQQAQRREDR